MKRLAKRTVKTRSTSAPDQAGRWLTRARAVSRRMMPPGRAAGRRGRRAERRAERFLRRRGLTTLARNFTRPYGEIDLVMRDGAVLVFVEVRLRGPGAWEDGAASVDAAKQRRLARTAEAYLAAHLRYASDASRFDVVSMSGTHFSSRVVWIPDAFSADG